LTGLRPSLVLVAAGAFGMSLWLTVLNGIYTTIVQVKVPQRFHGRVFALNTLIAWSTLPVGLGLVGPYGIRLLDRIGGPGHGTALAYVVFGAVIAGFALAGLAAGRLSRFDDEVPDAPPDDLVGAEALRRKLAPPAATPAPVSPEWTSSG